MYWTHEAKLNLPDLPLTAHHVHIVPAFTSMSLLSIGQVCDAGCCTVTFEAHAVYVGLNNIVILTGNRTLSTGVWHINLLSSPTHAPTPTPDASRNATSETPVTLVEFAHAALFSPALLTLHLTLQRGFIPNLPRLIAKTLTSKHPPNSVAMVKGHLDQSRKNQKSTKSKLNTRPMSKAPNCFSATTDINSIETPSSFINNESDIFTFPTAKSSMSELTIVLSPFSNPPPGGQIPTDQIGQFIVASSHAGGNNYILVLYDYDSNSILVTPMRSCTGPCILKAFQTVHARAGLRPLPHRFDNECLAALNNFLTDEGIDYYPLVHTKCAICAFKSHFIAGLCSVDKDFPFHLWDQLLPQAK